MKRIFSCFKDASSNQIPEQKSESPEDIILQPNDPRYNLASTSHFPLPPMPPYKTLAHYENLFNLPGETFLWPEIVAGTENKKPTHYLGKGSFSEVYRCDFPKILEMKHIFSYFKSASSSQISQQKWESPEDIILQPNDPRYNLASTSPFPLPPTPPYNTLAFYESLFKLPGETFLWQEIVAATENLKPTHYLGKGSFGQVYRCDFPEILEVGAAKILSSISPQGHVEFMAEINIIHEINHPNIITILGKCYQSTHRAIVYEFMPNGSLNYHLFPSSAVPDGLRLRWRGVDWATRMKIALGVGEALVYLHSAKQMIHRDIKIENVLLDKDFVPKLTDFGLATPIRLDLVRGVETERRITPIMGTPGCFAPETEESGSVSTKSDVYGYGVFLIQLVTGKKANDETRPFQDRKIVDWIRPFLGDENVQWLVDPALGNGFSRDGVKRVLMAARMCVSEQSLERPAMDLVVSLVREAGNYPI